MPSLDRGNLHPFGLSLSKPCWTVWVPVPVDGLSASSSPSFRAELVEALWHAYVRTPCVHLRPRESLRLAPRQVQDERSGGPPPIARKVPTHGPVATRGASLSAARAQGLKAKRDALKAQGVGTTSARCATPGERMNFSGDFG